MADVEDRLLCTILSTTTNVRGVGAAGNTVWCTRWAADCVILGYAAAAALCCRGYTRKEPYARGLWTPMAENWNGR